jgi:hypothetical protein
MIDIVKYKSFIIIALIIIILYKIISFSLSSLIILFIGMAIGVYMTTKFKNYIENYEFNLSSLINIY